MRLQSKTNGPVLRWGLLCFICMLGALAACSSTPAQEGAALATAAAGTATAPADNPRAAEEQAQGMATAVAAQGAGDPPAGGGDETAGLVPGSAADPTSPAAAANGMGTAVATTDTAGPVNVPGGQSGQGGQTTTVPKSDGSNPNAVNPYPDYTSDIYKDDDMWMCRPGLAKNYCLEDMDATEALPDGSFQPFMDDLRIDHPIDCLFWYPTVNRTEEPTSLDFSDPEPMLASIRSQAARFSRVCNVYAPFYRQTSLNRGGDAQLGFQDVVESFKHYIANWSEGRNFVIYGHSQGTGHAMRLISQEIDNNPDLRERLVSALLIGGRLAADSFSNIPLCTAPEQLGCAVGYQTYGVDMSLRSIAADLACTNPGALGGGKAIMKGAFFPSAGANYSPDLGSGFTEPWGLYRDFFTAECVEAPSGGEVLQIDYAAMPGDMRAEFLNLDREVGFGLHVFDYQFTIDDLIELVRTQRDGLLAGTQP